MEKIDEEKNMEESGEEDESEEEDSKISLPEGILVSLIVLFADGVEFLVDLTGVGIIIGQSVNFTVGGGVSLYLVFKRGRLARKLATFGVGTILDGATASLLPIKTITFLITWFLINHPKTIPGLAQLEKGAGAMKGE